MLTLSAVSLFAEVSVADWSANHFKNLSEKLMFCVKIFRKTTDLFIMAEGPTRLAATNAQSLHTSAQSLSTQEVTAVIQSHTEWASGARTHATALVGHLPQLIPDGLPSLSAFAVGDLCEAQSRDSTLFRIRFLWGGPGDPPDRKEHRSQVLRFLKHWEKFVLSDDV